MSQMPQQPNYQSPTPVPPFDKAEVANKKMMTGILGIVLGGFGVHRFLLGDTTGGILRIVIAVVTCGAGGIIGIIEGIIYLTKTDEQFYQEYMVQKKAWF
jgi:TM2 domain-containing membrane protein YozV